ncbi:MAG TPA: RT0821/Lpp0805 family surface protein [Alphaproteobacteria bacterium]|nr:glycine zipper 2TM domain-containing protein [Alphaproteobacteria bacterium]MCB9984949.1 glycine zipper 2TM domain-containing protein [Micavibrio sp.]HRK97340.1 RT0821/Lpp0805 family surface protein [Alphaproteobacteria bacterium]
MKMKFLALLVLVSLSMTACMENTGNKQMVGSATGAVLGGVAGAQFGKGTGQLVGVGVGALLGTLIGSELGKSLDQADRMYANQAQSKAYSAPLNETISWNNPDSGHSGTITPVKEGYSNTSGSLCREYSQTIYVDGRQQTGYGRACQNPDGSWQIVN